MASKGEESLFQLLRDEFPREVIIGQQVIKTGANKSLFIDYYLPGLRLAFETDGRQHSEFVAFFHKNVGGYEKSKANDAAKEEWCKDNKVTMLRFGPREKINVDTLRLKIKEASEVGKSKRQARPSK